ncbi:uncharacterized [Tachysurus ichikawai]
MTVRPTGAPPPDWPRPKRMFEEMIKVTPLLRSQSYVRFGFLNAVLRLTTSSAPKLQRRPRTAPRTKGDKKKKSSEIVLIEERSTWMSGNLARGMWLFVSPTLV